MPTSHAPHSPEAQPPRTAIVTGGERGIGLHIAKRLLANHYQVVVAGVDDQSAEANLPDLAAHGRLQYIRCDVGNEEEVAAMAARTRREFGGIHGLVCNAALARAANGPLERLSLEHWERVMRVNVTGAFLCAKHCIGALRASRGAIVLISSVRAHASEPDTEAYSTSKAALLGLNHSLANSCGPQVRVNAVCPGWVPTDPHDHISPEDHRMHPVGRVGKVQDVSAAVLFLLDPVKAAFITGQYLNVDGGMSARLGYH
jgi:NAD(P)-dependent dehydrogenase (short-subunit alcohol dehydrogenase family)